MKKGKQKEKRPIDIGISDFYNYYASMYFRVKENGKTKIYKDSIFYIDRSLYSKIVGEFNKEICRLILEENYDFVIPARLGVIGIRKKKPIPYIDEDGSFINTLPVDWKKTKDLWNSDEKAKEKKTIIRHLNKKTYGYIAKFIYFKNTANYKNKSKYKIQPCRTLKRRLSNLFSSGKTDYYEI